MSLTDLVMNLLALASLLSLIKTWTTSFLFELCADQSISPSRLKQSSAAMLSSPRGVRHTPQGTRKVRASLEVADICREPPSQLVSSSLDVQEAVLRFNVSIGRAALFFKCVPCTSPYTAAVRTTRWYKVCVIYTVGVTDFPSYCFGRSLNTLGYFLRSQKDRHFFSIRLDFLVKWRQCQVRKCTGWFALESSLWKHSRSSFSHHDAKTGQIGSTCKSLCKDGPSLLHHLTVSRILLSADLSSLMTLMKTGVPKFSLCGAGHIPRKIFVNHYEHS